MARVGWIVLTMGVCFGWTPLGAQGEQIPLGEVTTVACKDATDKTYALYLPTSYRPNQTWPLLLLFDPAARATVPVQRFVGPAETFGFILVSPFDSRNYVSFEQNWESIGAVWNDVIGRFAIDGRRMYAGGFSGGARLASRVAVSTQKIAGLVLCGAGLAARADQAPPPKVPIVSTVGHLDFNFYELVALESVLEKAGTPHRRLTFLGSHQWPPEDAAFAALGWLQTLAHEQGMISRESVHAEAQIERTRADIEQLAAAGEILAAHRRRRQMLADFKSDHDLEDIAAAAAEAESGDALADARKAFDRADRFEKDIRAKLFRRLSDPKASEDVQGPRFQREMAWWEKEVAELRDAAAAQDDRYRANAAQRVLNNIGSLCYERSVYVFRQMDYRQAVALNRVAEIAAPEAAFPPFHQARAYAQLGDKDAAIAALERFLAKGGGSDALRQAALLAPLKDDPRFIELLNR